MTTDKEIFTLSTLKTSDERYQSRIIQLYAEVARLKADTARLDWLSDPENTVGQVLLPTAIVERNIGSLRDAIDEAMRRNRRSNERR